ncbi:MAG: DMT family transporter [Candidatus Njordarchaeales archaeon]
MVNTLGAIMAFLGAFCWALASIFYRKALVKFADPLIISMLRIPLAITVLILVALLNHKLIHVIKMLRNPYFMLFLLLATILMNIFGDTLYLLAIRNVGVAIGFPLSTMYPLLVAILATVILGEECGIRLVLGTVIAIAGVWLLSKNKRDLNTSTSRFLVGIMAGVGAALSFSLGIIFFRITVTEADPIATAIIKLILLFIMLLPYVLFKHDSIKNLDTKTAKLTIIGGAIGLGIGDWLFYIGLSKIGAGPAATIAVSSPMFSVLLAMSILREKVSITQFVGVIMIVAGILLSIY